MTKLVTAKVRGKLVAALRKRYKAGNRDQKGRILGEFVAPSGHHRKSAIRILNGDGVIGAHTAVRGRRCFYDDAQAWNFFCRRARLP
jgi:hypothetical protein